MSIGLDELTVLQDDLRHFSQMDSMIRFVADGEFWTLDKLALFAAKNGLLRVCPLIEIAAFPDGRLMVHDGHHRIIATHLGGRPFIRSSEFIIKHWDYENYMNINFSHKWVTPLDPRSEVRVADIALFKNTVLDILGSHGAEEARKFILENKASYVRTRMVSSVVDLTERYLMRRSDSSYECFEYDQFA